MGVRLRVSVEVRLVDEEGRVVVDETTGRLLLLIDKCGSILCAARSLGLAYSRAWERIGKLERLLGAKVVEVRRGGRGGGGARLTSEGREVLAHFLEAYRRVHGSDPPLEPGAPAGEGGVLLYAGSSDPALARLIGMLRGEGVLIEAHWIGSLNGLATILLGEADVAGIHIVNPETGEYNVHLLRALAEATDVVLVRGYRRLQGFALREPMSVEGVFEGLLSGRLRLVNREEGTGTRLLLETLLRRWARERGVEGEPSRLVRGWDNIARTHFEAAERIAGGEADVGLLVEAAARAYGLHFIPVAWEQFDFVTRRRRLERGPVSRFVEALCSEEFLRLLSGLPGYKPSEDMCRVVRVS